MGKYFRLLFIIAITSLAACQEGREAGDLWGQWRLKDSDYQYVSFSGSVTLFRAIGYGSVFGNFQHVGDSVFIQCCSVRGERGDTAVVEDKFGLKPFTDIRVKVETLDHETLVISDGPKIWAFKRY